MIDTFSTYRLLYGNYHEMHKRVLGDLRSKLPEYAHKDIVIWCNQVCKKTLDLLQCLPATVYETSQNVPKYVLMRYLFTEKGITNPWILWLDDDTRIEKKDWWEKTKEYIDSKEKENICFVGPHWFSGDIVTREKFVRKASWYRNKPWDMRNGQPVIHFPIGGYWWLRTDVQEMIDWPDPRLSHNGGDTLLAEAVRQQGLSFHRFAYGIKVQVEKRRGRQEKPIGMRGGVSADSFEFDPALVKVWRGK